MKELIQILKQEEPKVDRIVLEKSETEEGAVYASIFIRHPKYHVIIMVNVNEDLQIIGKDLTYNEIEQGEDEPVFSDDPSFPITMLYEFLAGKKLSS